MAKQLVPLEDRVLLELIEPETTTASGIIIPDNATEKPNLALVVAVGEGKKCKQTGELCPVNLKVGDTVLVGKYAGQAVKHEGKEYTILRYEEILALIK